MSMASLVLRIAALSMACVALTACDQAEQGRITTYQKGIYLGKPDTPLSDAQVNDLRQRAARQGGS